MKKRVNLETRPREAFDEPHPFIAAAKQAHMKSKVQWQNDGLKAEHAQWLPRVILVS